MKPSLAALEPLFASILLTATLAGCGGGSDAVDLPHSPGSASPVPPPAGSAPPPAPAPQGTGLGAPTLLLTLDSNEAVLLAKKMVDAGDQAPGAAATLALGPLDLAAAGNSSPMACPGGGTVSSTGSAGGVQTQTYDRCSTGPYTFNGTATLTPTFTGGVMTRFNLDFNGLQASGRGSPPSLTGSLDCTVSNAFGAVPACVSSFAHIKWGWDSVLTDAGMSGTHQCSCPQGTWNVSFANFAASSGRAFVYATNGTADVTRTGTKAFTVVLTVEGSTRAFAVTLD
ncbi:MAG TPA: hypothetical protein VFL86_17805 [Burkholderiaceae bacterium]|nr:hypothetical protein [Burkholderiaceae bacterium]